MKYLLLALIAISCNAYSQTTTVIVVKDKNNKEPIIGAIVHVEGTSFGGSSDADGIVILSNIPTGQQIVSCKYLGYNEHIDSLTFPLNSRDSIVVYMERSEGEELEAITVNSTRSTRTISDVPTRIELISGEELEEKGNMKPGDIRMLLAESTGIQTQQTSATSANASIRIQGMDGRYTQILKDGFPLYSGAASGLGLLQTPPLDLKQVEVIKGSSSTLFGGGAIAGLVNLISKTPSTIREIRFHVNGTSAGGLDINGYYGQRFGKIGTTLFASRNSNFAYDPANIGLSAIPKFERYTFNPKLFLYPTQKTTVILGINTTWENRIGGSMPYIKGNYDTSNSYYEQNVTKRFSTQLSLSHTVTEHSKLTLKNSYSYFDRGITIPGYKFDGIQHSTFTELNYATGNEKLEWIGGLNLWTDGFKELKVTNVPVRNYVQTTFGAFIQNTWKVHEKLIVESGIREDYVINYGFAFLPRVSVLYKPNLKISSRLGGGLGYKAPTIFTEESERIQYQNVLAISADSNKLEKSYGANWDINYRTSFADHSITFSINHLFYYTHLNNPLTLIPTAGKYRFSNINGHMDSKGTETNIKLGYKDFHVFIGYTYTDAYLHLNGLKTENPLTPKHRINSVVMYEVEDKWKVGLEAYYFSPQRLSDGTTGKDYWIMGFMAEKSWKKFSLYINFENFLDARQTRFDTIYTGALNNPQFREIYAPLDGFVINGGLKIRI
ncbi:MAG: TonB-dependent receptor plug domain-containing protein [Taibaiella sp.]|nr:TonB-dependent receptor plug domain-containing protein [Taibaiella sp.]